MRSAGPGHPARNGIGCGVAAADMSLVARGEKECFTALPEGQQTDGRNRKALLFSLLLWLE